MTNRFKTTFMLVALSVLALTETACGSGDLTGPMSVQSDSIHIPFSEVKYPLLTIRPGTMKVNFASMCVPKASSPYVEIGIASARTDGLNTVSKLGYGYSFASPESLKAGGPCAATEDLVNTYVFVQGEARGEVDIYFIFLFKGKVEGKSLGFHVVVADQD